MWKRDGNASSSAPNQLWLTDIVEHPTREGPVYCCAVLGAFSRRVVGWSIDSSQTTALVMKIAYIPRHRSDLARPGV